jgi:hypothetical protein
MAAYLIRRLWQMIPTLLGVVLLVFFLFKYFGSDPAIILGGLNASAEQIESIREQLGLNKPVWEQLLIFIKQIVTFDWGKSWATNESVANLFATRLPATLTVTVPILILEVALAIPFALAVATARQPDRPRGDGLHDRGRVHLAAGLRHPGAVRVRVPARLVPGAGLDEQPLDQPDHLCAAAGARRRRGVDGAADPPVPQLLPR